MLFSFERTMSWIKGRRELRRGMACKSRAAFRSLIVWKIPHPATAERVVTKDDILMPFGAGALCRAVGADKPGSMAGAAARLVDNGERTERLIRHLPRKGIRSRWGVVREKARDPPIYAIWLFP